MKSTDVGHLKWRSAPARTRRSRWGRQLGPGFSTTTALPSRPPWIGHTDNRDIGNRWVGRQDVLDLSGVDVLPHPRRSCRHPIGENRDSHRRRGNRHHPFLASPSSERLLRWLRRCSSNPSCSASTGSTALRLPGCRSPAGFGIDEADLDPVERFACRPEQVRRGPSGSWLPAGVG